MNFKSLIVSIFLVCVFQIGITEIRTRSDLSNQEWINLNTKLISTIRAADLEFKAGQYIKAKSLYGHVLSYNAHDRIVRQKFDKSSKMISLVEHIQSAYQYSHYPKALDHIQTLLELNPADKNYHLLNKRVIQIIAHFKAGNDLFRDGHYKKSIEKFQSALELHSEDKQIPIFIKNAKSILAYQKLAANQFYEGQYQKSLKLNNDILALNSDDINAKRNLLKCQDALAALSQADNSLTASDYHNAVAALSKVLELNPDDQMINNRKLNYLKIMAYYHNNKLLLKGSHYTEVLHNYARMKKILPNNRRILDEEDKYQQCKIKKDAAYRLFDDEEYQQVRQYFVEILNLNTLDQTTSENIHIMDQVLSSQARAKNFYRDGNYNESLDIYKSISMMSLIPEIKFSNSYNLIRGQLATLSIPIEPSTNIYKVSGIMGNGETVEYRQDKGRMWTGDIFLPVDHLEGYSVQKIYVKDMDQQVYQYQIPYYVEEQKILAPSGYTIDEINQLL